MILKYKTVFTFPTKYNKNFPFNLFTKTTEHIIDFLINSIKIDYKYYDTDGLPDNWRDMLDKNHKTVLLDDNGKYMLVVFDKEFDKESLCVTKIYDKKIVLLEYMSKHEYILRKGNKLNVLYSYYLCDSGDIERADYFLRDKKEGILKAKEYLLKTLNVNKDRKREIRNNYSVVVRENTSISLLVYDLEENKHFDLSFDEDLGYHLSKKSKQELLI